MCSVNSNDNTKSLATPEDYAILRNALSLYRQSKYSDLSKELLTKLFLEEDHSLDELVDYFQSFSKSTIRRRLKEFGLTKKIGHRNKRAVARMSATKRGKSTWNKGKHNIYSQETLTQMRQHGTAAKASQMKYVKCIELNEIFSLKEAAAFAQVTRTTIISCARGRLLTAGGYHWVYEEAS